VAGTIVVVFRGRNDRSDCNEKNRKKISLEKDTFLTRGLFGDVGASLFVAFGGIATSLS